MSAKGEIRVGLIGAGYVALRHLVALRDLDFVRVVGIADPDRKRAAELAGKFGVEGIYSNASELLAACQPQAVHILTPPATHADLACEALAAGCHVLVEKPMAESVAECERMIAAAKAAGRVLSVNHSARYEPPVLEALAILKRGGIGEVTSIQMFRGSDYPPFAGGPLPTLYRQGSYLFRDLGVHALYLFEAFGGKIDTLAVEHASSGRDPLMRFDEWRLRARCGGATAAAVISLNMQPVQNCLWIHGTKGTLYVDCFLQLCEWHRTYPGPKQLHAVINAVLHSLRRLWRVPLYLLRVLTGKAKPSPGIYICVQEFHRALAGQREVPVEAAEGMRAVRWIESESRAADAEHEEWRAEQAAERPAPARILVTGASGFLGGALVSRLRESGERPRVLLRRPVPAGHPAADLPAVYGDLGDPEVVRRAVEGVEVVYHVGAGMKGAFAAGTVWGTRNVVEQCVEWKVKRLVYVSSMGILDHAGRDAGATVDETSPLEPKPERRGEYSKTKLEAEGIVRRAIEAKQLNAVIVRPGQIIGPGAEATAPNGVLSIGGQWIVAGLGHRKLPLVYVDDVVDGLIAAETSPEALGQTINLVDPEKMNQNEYLGYCVQGGSAKPVRRIPVWVLMLLGMMCEMGSRLIGKELPLSRYRVASLRPLYPVASDRAAQYLNWKPRVGIRAGLRRMWQR